MPAALSCVGVGAGAGAAAVGRFTVHTIGLVQELSAGRQLDTVHSPHSRALAGSRQLPKQFVATQTPNVPKHAVQFVERPTSFLTHVLTQIGP